MFTYDPANVTDITRVRFHVFDTNEATAMFSDEEIQMVLDEQTSWQRAVIVLIEAKIAEVASTPSFTADWLRVDQASALNGLKELLQQKKRQFGFSGITVSSGHVYRADSGATEAPNWADYANDDLYDRDWSLRKW